MSKNVHVLHNPIKVITIKGNLNNSDTWKKPFAKQNGNIFNGYWMIAMKSFSYDIQKAIHKRILKVHCNNVTGFEHEKCGQPVSQFYPPIAQIYLTSNQTGCFFHDFDCPTFFLINNVNDFLDLNFSYFERTEVPPEGPEIRNIPFEAVFHYYCQSN